MKYSYYCINAQKVQYRTLLCRTISGGVDRSETLGGPEGSNITFPCEVANLGQITLYTVPFIYFIHQYTFPTMLLLYS